VPADPLRFGGGDVVAEEDLEHRGVALATVGVQRLDQPLERKLLEDLSLHRRRLDLREQIAEHDIT